MSEQAGMLCSKQLTGYMLDKFLELYHYNKGIDKARKTESTPSGQEMAASKERLSVAEDIYQSYYIYDKTFTGLIHHCMELNDKAVPVGSRVEVMAFIEDALDVIYELQSQEGAKRRQPSERKLRLVSS